MGRTHYRHDQKKYNKDKEYLPILRKMIRKKYNHKEYLPILLSTRASILFWNICGVVDEEKLLLVITLSSGFFFFR